MILGADSDSSRDRGGGGGGGGRGDLSQIQQARAVGDKRSESKCGPKPLNTRNGPRPQHLESNLIARASKGRDVAAVVPNLGARLSHRADDLNHSPEV